MNRRLDYVAKPVRPSSLETALEKAKAGPWIGWNVTAPHKVSILPYIDKLQNCARSAGAVNVVRFEAGLACGYNTDVDGFLAPLRRIDFRLAGRAALVLGSGGAARAVCVALRRAGVKRILILGRTPTKAAALARLFDVESGALEPAWLRQAARRFDLVVNATTLGMDGRGSPIPPGLVWKRGALAYDLVYRPRLTPFLRQADGAGARTLDGLAMLVAQACETWRLWFDQAIPAELASAAERSLERGLS